MLLSIRVGTESTKELEQFFLEMRLDLVEKVGIVKSVENALLRRVETELLGMRGRLGA